jgi:hypothetical protein
VIAALSLPLSAQRLLAQDGSFARCESASAAVAEHPLPAVGAAEWNNWITLTNCGSRGATVAAGVIQSRAVRTEADPARLDALAGILDGWFAPALVSAYESATASREASPAFRLRAMWLLAGLFSPAVEVAGPLQGYTASSCATYDRTTALRDVPRSLPQSVYDGARDTFAHVADDASAPQAVRNTARCWVAVVSGSSLAAAGGVGSMPGAAPADPMMSQEPMSSAQPLPTQEEMQARARAQAAPGSSTDDLLVPASPDMPLDVPVEVVYDCGDRYYLRNTGYVDMSVRYGIAGGAFSYMRVGPRGSSVILAPSIGATRFWVGDRELAFSTYPYRACGPDDSYGYAPLDPLFVFGYGYGYRYPYFYPRFGRPIFARSFGGFGGGFRGGFGGGFGGRAVAPIGVPHAMPHGYIPRTAVPRTEGGAQVQRLEQQQRVASAPRGMESRSVSAPRSSVARAPSRGGGGAPRGGGGGGGGHGSSHGGGRR